MALALESAAAPVVDGLRLPTDARGPHDAGAAADRPALVITAGGRLPRIGWRELWDYRTLLYFLVWRDLRVRYTQTVLGVGWAVLQPVLGTVVFTLIFGRIVHVPTDGVPYAAFALAALVPWTYVSTSVSAAGTSLLNSSTLITKVYFPRLTIPLAPVVGSGVDLTIGLALLAGALPLLGVVPGAVAVVAVPASIIAFAVTAAGVGCWTAALSVQFRDVKHLLPFATTMWMYASPIVYPASRVPARFAIWYGLNPLAGTIEGFRAALTGRPVAWEAWLESAAVGVLLFVTGALYFRRTERVFADVV